MSNWFDAPTPPENLAGLPVKIICANCGQAGTAAWGGKETDDPASVMASLESISADFYRRAPDGRNAISQVVCGKCGTVLD